VDTNTPPASSAAKTREYLGIGLSLHLFVRKQPGTDVAVLKTAMPIHEVSDTDSRVDRCRPQL